MHRFCKELMIDIETDYYNSRSPHPHILLAKSSRPFRFQTELRKICLIITGNKYENSKNEEAYLLNC